LLRFNKTSVQEANQQEENEGFSSQAFLFLYSLLRIACRLLFI